MTLHSLPLFFERGGATISAKLPPRRLLNVRFCSEPKRSGCHLLSAFQEDASSEISELASNESPSAHLPPA